MEKREVKMSNFLFRHPVGQGLRLLERLVTALEGVGGSSSFGALIILILSSFGFQVVFSD